MGDPYLGNVERTLVSLAVAEDNEDTSLFNSSADTLHFGGVPLQRVTEILVHEACVVNGILRPDAPSPDDVSYSR